MTVLLSLTIKVAMLMLAALAATLLLGRRSAAVRHWLLATTLAACFCLPAMELLVPAWTIQLPDAWSTAPATSPITMGSEPIAATGVRSTGQAIAVRSPSGTMPDLATLLTGVWIVGVAIGLSLLGAGLLRLRYLAAHSSPVSSGSWREIADEVASAYGIRQPIRLLDCQHPAMLATWGMRNPAILLPAGSRAWPEDRIRAVLQHELAHIARRDWIVALLATLLSALYWFNPLMWIACRRLRHESERACDDLVLSSGISGEEYATHLLDVAREAHARRHAWSPAIAIAHRSMLEGRVRAMLSARVNRQPVTLLGRAAIVAVIGLAAAAIGTASVSGGPEPNGAPATSLASPSTLPALPGKAGTVSPPPARARAQATPASGGTIEGVLYDPFGGLLPGVSLTLTQVGTAGSQKRSSDRGGAFAFTGLSAGDYELVTDLPGFTSVKNVLRAEQGATVRRYITLPIGTVQETISVTCRPSDASTAKPTASSGSRTPGPSQQSAPGQRGIEPKIPSTFTGGIGGQIKAPTKLSHTNPVCPTGVAPQATVVRLAGRIGIDGLFSDLHDSGADAQPQFVTSAMEAARKWVFTPTQLNGAPIEANIVVTISYSFEQGTF